MKIVCPDNKGLVAQQKLKPKLRLSSFETWRKDGKKKKKKLKDSKSERKLGMNKVEKSEAGRVLLCFCDKRFSYVFPSSLRQGLHLHREWIRKQRENRIRKMRAKGNL
jgi:hypothetical protein